ncbi:phosphoribosyltransferase [Melittangium boletus]|uniref:Phosphoribosyltransferase n=1 Tax=Melittangium boletus DSM 14713 TaxID=1294270 RepID=A0A250IEX3_9BACT|nr:phosphoribosyltransferase [Melittangium boletus]ATB29798.1 phosphoribosyltransferase [Melittangium boletus DSM 14713]
MNSSRYQDRYDAGRALAERLGAWRGRADVLVLALPRGGVPVGFEVARSLGVPLDIFLVRKLGMPGDEEVALGAIAAGGVRVLDQELIEQCGIGPEALARLTEREEREIARRNRLYRGERPAPDAHGRTVILVDDGLATGATMRAAVEALRKEAPALIIVGVPVAAKETCEALRDEVDDIICARTPEPFWAVGDWYQDFEQTSDEEVQQLLQRAAQEHVGAHSQGALGHESL